MFNILFEVDIYLDIIESSAVTVQKQAVGHGKQLCTKRDIISAGVFS